ncbi:hypothetical protein N657DRAFT_583969 [Parathielavia appendiculata]|uniref:Zn(2)-C6 fungal-type domain-containing protein n=1 Tax=Parathielavia appendiculata TaxID=2587402 RepID=A0AAN6YYH7_9PEZI|nr:hypothetical protein N657DRAFT_583969 [Parathielavia appendiculata]
MQTLLHNEASPDSGPARKKRIPVKCDGLRPCSRCRTLQKICEFVERPKDPYETKMEALEKEIESLKTQLQTPSNNSNSVPSPCSWPGMPLEVAGVALPVTESAVMAQEASLRPSGDSLTRTAVPQKRNRAHFEAGTPPTIPDLDPITAGLITREAAESFFGTFFSGCDRYVPVFDPSYDTFDSVRHRSAVLFSAICSVGCRVMTGSESHPTRRLGVHTQRMLNASIAAPPSRGGQQACLETVQAFLVRACYAPERSLLVAVATRMALELGLPEAFGVLSARHVTNSRTGMVATSYPFPEPATASSAEKPGDDGATLMRKTRTWLHLLMMGQILHVDAGGAPSFRFRGSAQRCRILLDSPFSTGMDLYLFAQVELNAIRARIHSTLTSYVRNRLPGEPDDDELMEMVSDNKIDLNVWFDDWTRIYEKHTARMPWLTPNLAVQRCWADSMAVCCALKAAGVENVNAMSSTQRAILGMAKRSLKQHLDIILEEPRVYLRSIRYAMDFVWAKNAFCYLLLLKLSILLPDEGDGRLDAGRTTNEELVKKGRILVHELGRAAGGPGNGPRNNSSSSLYLHLVRVSIEKFSRATESPNQTARLTEPLPQDALNSNIAGQQRRIGNTDEGEWAVDGTETELESFVPEQFVFEWDFPGLTFFSSPTHETSWLDDLLAGAIDGADNTSNFYGLRWASMDFNTS